MLLQKQVMWLRLLVLKKGNKYSIDADITNLNATGIVTAAQFVGNGSRITGVIGLGTAIISNTPVLGNIFYRNNTYVGSTVTMDVPDVETNVGYTSHRSCCRRWC